MPKPPRSTVVGVSWNAAPSRGWMLFQSVLNALRGSPVDAREADAAVYLVTRKLRLVDLRGNRIHLVREESVIQPVVPFGERTEHIPAQPHVHRQPARDLDIVLHPRRPISPTVVGPRDVIHFARRGRAQQHGGDGIAAQRIGRQVVGAGESLIERERAPCIRGLVVRQVHQSEVEAGLDVVPPLDSAIPSAPGSSWCWARTRCYLTIRPCIGNWPQ